jgi:hypothetical protein
MRIYQRPQHDLMHQHEFRAVDLDDRTVSNSIDYLRDMCRRSVLNFQEVRSLYDSSVNVNDARVLRQLEMDWVLRQLEMDIDFLNTTHFHFQRAYLRTARHNAVVAQTWIANFITSFGVQSALLVFGVQPMIEDIIEELDFLLSFLMP